MSMDKRCYGLLCHISSLPSAWGIGDLGPEAHAFAHKLAHMGASIWQFLPLNPTSTYIGNSPYSSPSAFAGNPLFISPEYLLRDGYITYSDLDASLSAVPARGLCPDPAKVDFEAVTAHRNKLLADAFEHNRTTLDGNREYADFCRENGVWLRDYARFMSLKAAFDGAAWFTWPAEYARRDPEALEAWDASAALAIEREKFIQFLFFAQWAELRKECAALGVALLADVPIYVTHDSADVWANPGYFNLDENLQPITVSGVPPDYFSTVGQRWGNPVYKWDALQRDDFIWWKQRLGQILKIADIARLDHFRGFCGYWEIPAEEETAVNGTWRPAPGKELFTSIECHFKGLPFLAEDLGVITPDVCDLMKEFNLPGMHVLQFAFGGERFFENPNIPHLHNCNSYVYTGTHDNMTSRGWFANAPHDERKNFRDYAGRETVTDEDACALLTRQAFASIARCAVLPVQDALNLGDEARMNTPGLADGNWGWRLTRELCADWDILWLKELARIYGRLQ